MKNNSTIFCTQFKIESWHSRLDGGVHADAIMDRIIHNSITINAGDINMREATTNMSKE
ncbi:ATP-binding protein [Thomasclavelia spiroformis]|uniref:ATP-binding protein n=1 Tax=Thomasclavelia spiroformis TaxID=29348 RepID=UPI00399F73CC